MCFFIILKTYFYFFVKSNMEAINEFNAKIVYKISL